jgi:hypothetical protein
MRNPCLEIAMRELEAAGIRGIEQSHGSKHLQLRWRINGGGLRLYSLPCPPSDFRAADNTRAEVRRLLREDGVLVSEPKPKPVSPKPKKPDRVAILEQRVAALEQAIRQLERK